MFSKSGYMPCERVLLGWAWNECDIFWEIRDLIWLWLFSTPRSLYSLLMSALILVCLWLPTSSTGMPLSSARLRKRSKSRFSIACELVLCFTWQTSKSTIFTPFVHHGVISVFDTIAWGVTTSIPEESEKVLPREVKFFKTVLSL